MEALPVCATLFCQPEQTRTGCLLGATDTVSQFKQMSLEGKGALGAGAQAEPAPSRPRPGRGQRGVRDPWGSRLHNTAAQGKQTRALLTCDLRRLSWYL